MSFSVLMAVHAKEKPVYLEQSLLSIWSQQILKPDQIVLVKDGILTDELEFVISRINNDNNFLITQVQLEINVGLAVALNEGLKYCKAELVARMDSDDISLPNRFNEQISFMEANPDVAACSGVVEEFNSIGTGSTMRFLPLHHDDLVKFAKLRSPLSHPATMFRKSALINVGGYPPLRNAQDYALWALLIVNGYKLANLPNVLVRMRIGGNMLDRRGFSYFLNEVKLLCYQRRIGFLSMYEFSRNLLGRFILRVVPRYFKNLFYGLLR